MMNETYVMTVEAQKGNMEVLARFLEKMNVIPLKAPALSDIHQILDTGVDICVALIDIMGFDDSIWEYCKELRAKGIPMMIISPSNNQQLVKTGYDYGAIRVFNKPVLMQELSASIRSFIRKEINNRR